MRAAARAWEHVYITCGITRRKKLVISGTRGYFSRTSTPLRTRGLYGCTVVYSRKTFYTVSSNVTLKSCAMTLMTLT